MSSHSHADLAAPGFDRALFVVLPIGLGAWIGFAVWQGYDFEWDVLNYHYYNGFALLHGKSFANLQPAGMQTYFAPLMDAVFYLMARLWPPTAVVVAIAAFQSLVIPVLFQLARTLLLQMPGPGNTALAAALALLGACAPTALYEAGGALGDSTTAVLVLAALGVLVGGIKSGAGGPGWRRAAVAGALAGAAAGLKLTNVAFAVALMAALAACLPLRGDATIRRGYIVTIAGCLAGMAAAFLLTYGWWGVLVYRHFGNPVFPEFNQLFRSPYAAPTSFSDPIFALPTWHDKLLFPFLRTSISGRLDAAGLYDLRMAFAVPLCIGGLVAAAFRGAIVHGTAAPLQRPGTALMVFVLVGYTAWLLMFPINRYLVAVDMVAPLACVVAATLVWQKRLLAWSMAATLAVVLPVSARTALPLWWLPGDHRHGNEGGYFGVQFTPPPNLDGSVVAMLGGWPSTFVIPSFPRHTRFARLQGSMLYPEPVFAALTVNSTSADRRGAFGNAMGAAICHMLDENKGALFLLRPAPDTAQDVAALRYYGIEQAPGACTPVLSKSTLAIELCPARRTAAPECR
jgi:hypothetical protein